MESLYFLIPLSMVVVGVGIWLFFWAVNNGQYDDLDGEAERILFDNLDGDANAEKDVKRVSGCHVKPELSPNPKKLMPKSEAPPEASPNGVNSEND
jgi:cbb3-type cytochrome oxidase maturation protein